MSGGFPESTASFSITVRHNPHVSEKNASKANDRDIFLISFICYYVELGHLMPFILSLPFSLPPLFFCPVD